MTSPREAIDDHFPNLAADGYRITSPGDDSYNCVAWVARDLSRWWEPAFDGAFWPREVNESELEDGDLDEYLEVFRAMGFKLCGSAALEHGAEKIAIFANGSDFQHVAYQRSDGEWSSKLGSLNDVRHRNCESLSGSGAREYPKVAVYMARRREPHHLAESETGLLTP